MNPLSLSSYLLLQENKTDHVLFILSLDLFRIKLPFGFREGLEILECREVVMEEIRVFEKKMEYRM